MEQPEEILKLLQELLQQRFTGKLELDFKDGKALAWEKRERGRIQQAKYALR